jgi:hypothetical protein
MQSTRWTQAFSTLFAAATFAFLHGTFSPQAVAADSFTWSVQYLIDQSQPCFGESQFKYPRSVRSVALSPDYKTLYLGYLRGPDGVGQVRQVRIASTPTEDYGSVTEQVVDVATPKDIATDDRGRVYIATGEEVLVTNADLDRLPILIPGESVEALTVYRDQGDLYLLTGNRVTGLITRYRLTEQGDMVIEAKPSGFDGNGTLTLQNVKALRSLAVDGNGNIYATDSDLGKVFRISRDGTGSTSVDLPSAAKVVVDGDRLFVSRNTLRIVTAMSTDLQPLGDLTVPWEALKIDGDGNNNTGSRFGMAVVPGRALFVANGLGQTAGQRSTYGLVDDSSDIVDGIPYKDAHFDDNDPVLRADFARQ